jgi:UPF0755 protein
MTRRLLWAVGGTIAVLSVAAGAMFYGWTRYERPGPLQAPRTVIVPKGASVERIAEALRDKGILDRAWPFEFGVRLEGIESELKAGEYAFSAGVSARGAALVLHSGKTVVRRVTVPEGLTSAEILARLVATEGLEGQPDAVPPEGSLLPDTYHFSYGDRRGDILGRMRRSMDQTVAELWPKRAGNLPLESPGQAIILASIVERETGVADERARVAGVFINRLRRGMPLQSDPTVAYAITAGRAPLERPLTRGDLAIASPYNTYVNGGLPPGPIANPGRSSIEASLQPETHEFLYFVASGRGGHLFARTLAEHNRNVQRYRAVQRGEDPQ